jgi:excinuclease ABC subunit A
MKQSPSNLPTNQAVEDNQELLKMNAEILSPNNNYTPNPHKYITVKGAREHNLKNVSIVIPKNKLVVFSGLSGSGKSSLVFDTIYAEGQRRYVESLSAYARQFLGLKEKPDVDSLDGLSPTISIDQKTTSQNPRSTVGTITEIYDYLRLLYSKIGIQHCAVCDAEISNESITMIAQRLLTNEAGKSCIILSPLIKDQKGWHRQYLVDMKSKGFRRVRIDNQILLLEDAENLQLNKQQKHSIEIVIDRIILNEDNRLRLIDSIESAMKYSEGKAIAMVSTDEGDTRMIHFNKNRACPNGHGSPAELEPRLFSFNSPHGACNTCTGLGVVTEIDASLVIPNDSLSIVEGCIKPLSRLSLSGGWMTKTLETLGVKHNFDLGTPWKHLTKKQQEIILYGDNTGFEGIITSLQRRYKETTSDSSRRDIESYMKKNVCPTCNGARLRKESLSVTVGGKNIAKIVAMPINNCLEWFDELTTTTILSDKQREIAKMIFKEIIARLRFLKNVGLEYLTLSRSSETLSGGEAQRIRLATQIGSGLTGVLYILDEPSIGLHQRDNTRLLETLNHLRNLGNTVLVVEHDEDTIRSSDFVVDIGPKAGKHGGFVVAYGSPEQIMQNPDSPTGRYLAGIDKIEVPKVRRSVEINKKESISLDFLEKELRTSWINQFSQLLRQ